MEQPVPAFETDPSLDLFLRARKLTGETNIAAMANLKRCRFMEHPVSS